jgi:hypothetical protein
MNESNKLILFWKTLSFGFVGDPALPGGADFKPVDVFSQSIFPPGLTEEARRRIDQAGASSNCWRSST